MIAFLPLLLDVATSCQPCPPCAACPTPSPFYDPAFIAAATTSILAIIATLGGILVKLFAMSRSADVRGSVGEHVNASVGAIAAQVASEIARRREQEPPLAPVPVPVVVVPPPRPEGEP